MKFKISRNQIFSVIAVFLFALCLAFVVYFLSFMKKNIEGSLGESGGGGPAIRFEFDKLEGIIE